jgi:hypothetical protein
MRCHDNADYILDTRMCLYEISKDVPEGDMRLTFQDQELCPERDCETLKTIHQLGIDLHRGPCDSAQSSRVNGRLYSCDLIHTINVRNGGVDGRGFHGGAFSWTDRGFLATGTLSGITNAGTHRSPIEPACQECRAPGFMEGRFCGTIRRSRDPSLIGCQVFGSYRLQFAGDLLAPINPVRAGVMEGLIMCDCKPQQP